MCPTIILMEISNGMIISDYTKKSCHKLKLYIIPVTLATLLLEIYLKKWNRHLKENINIYIYFSISHCKKFMKTTSMSARMNEENVININGNRKKVSLTYKYMNEPRSQNTK